MLRSCQASFYCTGAVTVAVDKWLTSTSQNHTGSCYGWWRLLCMLDLDFAFQVQRLKLSELGRTRA